MTTLLRLAFWVAAFALMTYWIARQAHDAWMDGSHDFGLWASGMAIGLALYQAWKNAQGDDA